MNRQTFAAGGEASGDGHTLTFLANSGTRMADNGLTVDLDTLKIPLSDGSLKPLADLNDSDKITVPLLLDHVPSVDFQAGTVTRLWRDDTGLMATARLSDVRAGQTVQQLAKDGALTNSFSITVDFAEKPKRDGIIHNAELVEISVVFRGADSKAAFRSINNKEGAGMQLKMKSDAIDKALASFKLSDDEKASLLDAIKSAMQDALDEIGDAVDENSETPSDSGDGGDTGAQEPEQPNAGTAASARQVGNTTIILNKANRGVSSTARVMAGRKTWLDSPEAFAAFERNLFNSDGLMPEKVMDKWAAFAREKMGQTASFGITQDDISKFIPTEAITTITDALNTRGSGIWDALHKTGLDRLTVGANVAGLTDATRAHGYQPADYGTAKKEQVLTFVARKIEAEYTYKFLTLNKSDLRKTQRPGALLRYILQELPNYIVQTIERSIVLGGYDDMVHFRSIMTDAKDDASDWRGNKFALNVMQGTSSVLLYDFVRAAHKVTATGTKFLVTSADMLTDLLLSQDAEGRTLIDLGDEGVARRIGVDQIITPEWYTAEDSATALGVVFTPSNYAVVGDTSIEAFTNFALKTNTNEYLQEIYAGGALEKEKSACVILPTAAGGDAGTGAATTKASK